MTIFNVKLTDGSMIGGLNAPSIDEDQDLSNTLLVWRSEFAVAVLIV